MDNSQMNPMLVIAEPSDDLTMPYTMHRFTGDAISRTNTWRDPIIAYMRKPDAQIVYGARKIGTALVSVIFSNKNDLYKYLAEREKGLYSWGLVAVGEDVRDFLKQNKDANKNI